MVTLYSNDSASNAYQKIKPYVPDGSEKLKIKIAASKNSHSKIVGDVEQASNYVKAANRRSSRFIKETKLSLLDESLDPVSSKKSGNGKLPVRVKEVK